MERSRRAIKQRAPASKFEELKAARAGGKSRLEQYNPDQDANTLYDEIDEVDYQRAKLQDDFVVDDHGEGYVDNGMELERDRQYSSEEDEAQEDRRRGGKRGKKAKGKKENEVRVTEGAIDRLFRKPAIQMPKKVAVSTEEDADFMASILGELDESSVTVSRKRDRLTHDDSRPAKKRHSSPTPPPLRNSFAANRQPRAQEAVKSEIPSSPPMAALNLDSDDGGFMDIDHDDSYYAPQQSSSPAKEKNGTNGIDLTRDESDDDDIPVVKKLSAAKPTTQSTKSINISASRPAPPPKVEVKKEPSPVPEVPDATWRDLDSTLNVTAAPTSSSSNKASPSDVVETVSMTVKEMVEQEDGTDLEIEKTVEKQVVNVFWLDYGEFNGVLGLFGKVLNKTTGQWISCFVKIEGLERCLYFLPRETTTDTNEEVTMEDVYNEVNEILLKYRISEFRNRPVSKKYAFELNDVPRECDYLEVLYPFSKPPLANDLQGKTFSRVFGTTTALFERFVLERKVMGPCWLQIVDPDFSKAQNSTWTRLEFGVSSPDQVTPPTNQPAAPPLTLMSLTIRTTMNHKDNRQEIVLASGRVYDNVSLDDPTPADKLPCYGFTLLRPMEKGVFPMHFEGELKKAGWSNRVILQKTEGALLNLLTAKLQIIDPDVILGHNFESVDYGILLHRMKDCSSSHWSKFGRMRRSEWPKGFGRGGTSWGERQIVAGRLICDLSNDMGRSLVRAQSWTLTELCQLQLGTKRFEIGDEKAVKTWTSNAKGMMDFVSHAEADTFFIAAIALKLMMLPLTRQLTNIAGNSWYPAFPLHEAEIRARTLTGTRAERNEFILLHEFTKNDYICPDKLFGKAKVAAVENQEEDENGDPIVTSGKKKDKYKGGLVLEPLKGLYDKFILVMDFNSLYPSIIQEYNICFTTVDRADFTETDEESIPEVPDKAVAPGILPRLISHLVKRRQEVKKLMKDPKATDVQKAQWDTKQQALKLTANSMYGCLGYTKSRFYARPLAMLTTYKGREVLTNAKDLAEGLDLQVIYGDTDSVMINTNVNSYPEALKIGNEFKKTVNERYRLLEIDIDNVYQRLLLHAKKKYAALQLVEVNGVLEPKVDVKGLDMRRREYCALSKDASQFCLNQILSGEAPELVVEKIHDYLRELGTKVRAGEFPVQKFIIYTKLGKNPEDYPNAKSEPQVQVALRMKKRGDPVRVNDVIAYVITGDGQDYTKNVAERAYPPQDVSKVGSELQIDYSYYLAKQILPPIERLCAPIDCTDSARIAECLGFDPRQFRSVGPISPTERTIEPLESQISDEDRFRDADQLLIKCISCSESHPFTGISSSKDRVNALGVVCPNASCKAELSLFTINAQLETQIRQHLTRYYDNWLVCDEPACAARTRQMNVYGKRCLMTGCRGQMTQEYNDKMLYNQLLYYDMLFDIEKAKKKASDEDKDIVYALAEQNREGFEIVRGVVAKYLDKCGRRYVNLSGIFSFMA